MPVCHMPWTVVRAAPQRVAHGMQKPVSDSAPAILDPVVVLVMMMMAAVGGLEVVGDVPLLSL